MSAMVTTSPSKPRVQTIFCNVDDREVPTLSSPQDLRSWKSAIACSQQPFYSCNPTLISQELLMVTLTDFKRSCYDFMRSQGIAYRNTTGIASVLVAAGILRGVQRSCHSPPLRALLAAWESKAPLAPNVRSIEILWKIWLLRCSKMF